jgi:hypothetical protein
MIEILTLWQENQRDRNGILNNELFLQNIYDAFILEGINSSNL